MSRFYFAGESAADKLLAGADKLKLEVLRINGRLCATYELHGSIGSPFEDEDDATPPEPVDAAEFARGLLVEFTKGGGDHVA